MGGTTARPRGRGGENCAGKHAYFYYHPYITATLQNSPPVFQDGPIQQRAELAACECCAERDLKRPVYCLDCEDCQRELHRAQLLARRRLADSISSASMILMVHWIEGEYRYTSLTEPDQQALIALLRA